EGGRKHLQEQLDAVRHKVAAAEQRGEALWQEVESVLARVELEREDVEPTGKVPRADGDTPAGYEAPLDRADALLHRMRTLAVLRWMSWPAAVVIGLVLAAGGSSSALWLRPRFLGFAAGALAGLLVALLVRKVLYALAYRR